MESTKSYTVDTDEFAIPGDECMVVFIDTKEVEFVVEELQIVNHRYIKELY